MQKSGISEEIKEKIRKKVQQEFPGCKALQDLHYYRYVKEIEWQALSPAELVQDIKNDANQVKKEMQESVVRSKR